MTSAFEELKESRDLLFSLFSVGEVPEDFQENYTEMIDQYFRSSLQESGIGSKLFRKKRPFAIVALGGYGRRELCLHSDIDIMILFDSKIPAEAKELSNEFFLPLWDLGLDLGYSIRSHKDCLSLVKDNFEVLTSLIDARFICGDSPLYLSLMENIYKKIVLKKDTTFCLWLEDQNKIRMDTYGDASYLLEPNLKEGIGGLRDYHHILWLARVLHLLGIPRDLEYMGQLSHNEYRELKDNLRFIWLVRNYLHLLSGRKNDRLNFEYQEDIAHRLGYEDDKDFLAVERFLGRLHSCMASIKMVHRFFLKNQLPKKRITRKDSPSKEISEGIHIYQGELNFDSATIIIADPTILIKIFQQSALLGCSLSMEAMRLVREFLHLIDDNFRGSKKMSYGFLNILKGKHATDILDQMYETGFLDAFIPEFKQIRDRVQFDTYHIFPVGRHLLETVGYLKDLSNQKDLLLLDTFADLADPEPLLIAGLLHDIGKMGKDHASRGVSIAKNILKRFHYEKDKTEDVLFLIRHHLFLAETATRRDLNDEKVIVQCARTVGNAERLKMLYLLAWADSKATNPRAWNDWTANLVQELFFKVLHIIEGSELATLDASKRLKKTQSEIRRIMAEKMSNHELEEIFETMTPRYLLNTNPRHIADHMGMLQSLQERLHKHDGKTFIFKPREITSESCWEINFLAKDRPGLFSDLSGVLALNNINILSAQIYTWRDGTAVDIFRVSNPLDPIHSDETWEKVKKDLENTFKGKLSLAYRLDQKSQSSVLSRYYPSSRPPQVIVDNASSDFFTLIEVFAHDRIGLLYLITRCLFDLRLDIRIAKIATKGDQAADVFYVHDLDGQKVEDTLQVEEIKKALLHQLKQKANIKRASYLG